MTKQEKIEQLEAELKKAYEEILHLREVANQGFQASPEYESMSKAIEGYKRTESISEQFLTTEIKRDKVLLERIRKIRDDNIALCAEHGAEYWEGITEIKRWGSREVHDLEQEILELKARLEAKDIIIEHMRDVLSGIDPVVPKAKVMGRKPVPEDQKKRIRKYRKDGFKIKAIAAIEGVSVGAVSQICKGLRTEKKTHVRKQDL